MRKSDIRQKITDKRKRLNQRQVISKSKGIQQRLIMINEFRKAKTIMFYVSKDNEVRTQPAIELALRQGKKVCVPRVDKTRHTLHPVIIKDLEKDLAPGSYGILEPKPRLKSGSKIDLVIVPGTAFDLQGHRLGRGKAYYDRFLGNIKDTPKIGLAFEFQIVHKLPTDKHDVPMDKVLTEKRIIKQGGFPMHIGAGKNWRNI